MPQKNWVSIGVYLEYCRRCKSEVLVAVPTREGKYQIQWLHQRGFEPRTGWDAFNDEVDVSAIES